MQVAVRGHTSPPNHHIRGSGCGRNLFDHPNASPISPERQLLQHLNDWCIWRRSPQEHQTAAKTLRPCVENVGVPGKVLVHMECHIGLVNRISLTFVENKHIPTHMKVENGPWVCIYLHVLYHHLPSKRVFHLYVSESEGATTIRD